MAISHYLVREPAGDPEGMFFLLHGRGSDERDLFPLFEMLDPGRRLIGITIRGPLYLPPGGAHWYVTKELGYPDQATFMQTLGELRRWMASLAEGYGFAWDRCLIGGFSQGAVMSYALGCEESHGMPMGLVCFSGFIPTADGFTLRSDMSGLPVAIGHGTLDNVINVEWSRDAAETLKKRGAEVIFKEYHLTHSIDPAYIEEVRIWMEGVIAPRGGAIGA